MAHLAGAVALGGIFAADYTAVAGRAHPTHSVDAHRNHEPVSQARLDTSGSFSFSLVWQSLEALSCFTAERASA